MKDRITIKHLKALADHLNKITGSAMEYRAKDGTFGANHYHISQAYGGYCLHRLMPTGSGVTTPLSGGHISARELYNEMQAYIRGIELYLNKGN